MDNTPNPRTLARKSDPATSHEAAASIAGHVNRLQLKVLAGMGELEGLSGDRGAGAVQISAFALMEPYAARKRLPELKRKGLVEVVEGVTVKTESGRNERAWRLTSTGLELIWRLQP